MRCISKGPIPQTNPVNPAQDLVHFRYRCMQYSNDCVSRSSSIRYPVGAVGIGTCLHACHQPCSGSSMDYDCSRLERTAQQGPTFCICEACSCAESCWTRASAACRREACPSASCSRRRCRSRWRRWLVRVRTSSRSRRACGSSPAATAPPLAGRSCGLSGCGCDCGCCCGCELGSGNGDGCRSRNKKSRHISGFGTQ